MGVFREFYMVDGHPVFLPFSKYGKMMQLMRKMGKIPSEEAGQPDEFWEEKSQNRTIKDIEDYLTNLKKTNRCSFVQEWLVIDEKGNEAKRNVSNFLSGVCNYYKTFHIDSKSSQYDVAYPFGKVFYFGSSGNKDVLEVLFNTDEVDFIIGNVKYAMIGFITGGAIIMDNGKGLIISDNMAGKIDLEDYKGGCKTACGDIYYQKADRFWNLRRYK